MSRMKDSALTELHAVEIEGNIFHCICEVEEELTKWEQRSPQDKPLAEALALIKTSLRVIKEARKEIEQGIVEDCLFTDNKDLS